MGHARTFWIEFLLLLFAEAVVAGALWYTGRLGLVLADVGPLAIDGYVLLILLFAFGALLIAFHGGLRKGTGGRKRDVVTTGSVSADLLRLVSDHPAGTVIEGETLDAHLTSVVEATRSATNADGAALEIIEDKMVVKAYAGGSLAPYQGIRSRVQGTILETAFDSSNVVEWNEPPKGSQPSGDVKSMLIAPVRVGSRTLGVLRVVSSRPNAFSQQSALLETVARYGAAVLWKAPAKAFEEQESAKQAGDQEGAKDMRQRLERLVDAMDAAVWIVEPTKNRVILVNNAYEKLWGRSADALYRSPRAWLDALPAENRKDVEKQLDGEPDEPAQASYRFTRKDGTEALVTHSRVPLRDDHGGLIGVGHIALDSGERQRLSGELAALERHIAEAAENSPVMAYAARPGGDYGLIFVTPNVQQQLGYGPESFTGDATFWSAHLHPDDQTRVFEGLAKLFERGRLEQEYRFRHVDGTYHIVRDSARLLRSDEGEPLEIVGYWMDVTERKRTEEGVAYSLNRIKELQESRTRLLNNIAHDLGSPLTPVGLQLHMMRARTDLPEATQKGLAIIQRNVDHLALLIQDLKDVARLEAGQLKVDLVPCDLSEIVAKAAESFIEPAKERQLTLRPKVTRGLAVSADPQRINQVIFNFLTNALKFTPAGGTIDVSVAKSGSDAVVKVKDSGRGLTQEEIEKLFKPFSQVHDRTQMKEKGTGLGLYICKGLVEKHNGRVWVESEGHGEGSTFAFTIPLTGATQPKAAPRTEVPRSTPAVLTPPPPPAGAPAPSTPEATTAPPTPATADPATSAEPSPAAKPARKPRAPGTGAKPKTKTTAKTAKPRKPRVKK